MNIITETHFLFALEYQAPHQSSERAASTAQTTMAEAAKATISIQFW
jgi:hypothetical protein